MKKISLTLAILGITTVVLAQQTDTALIRKRTQAGQMTAGRIMQKMKDSLQLSDSAAQQIYNFTLQIQQQKYQVLDLYRGTSALPGQMTLVENTRDSLYATVIPPGQYQSYKQRKTSLVFNN